MENVETAGHSAAPQGMGRTAGFPTVQPLQGFMGAAVTGLDLSKPLDDSARDAIMNALVEHHILVFPNQNLTKDEQYAYTERFGEVEGHVVRGLDGVKSPQVHMVSNLDLDGKPTKTPATSGNFFWHTDKSYHDIPSLATLLHAKQIPPKGGSTQFANIANAYDELPDVMKDRIQGLRAVHSWEANRDNTFNRPATDEEKAERPPVSHPIVRTHPDSGRKVLYVGIHTSHIEGMPVAEGRELLYRLLDFATQPRFVHTHHWREGELVMWDNRCLMHRATGDFEMDKHARVLHRTVIRGTVPY